MAPSENINDIESKSAISKKNGKSETTIIDVAKKNIPQSPWKMNFLVKLARDEWLPEALAQLNFSPKRRGPEIITLLNRAAAVAKIYHKYIPEELYVKEIFVTKGFQMKKARIMGRGRTGVGYKRYTHVRARIEHIDFENKIDDAKSLNQKEKWRKRKELVMKLRKEQGLDNDDDNSENITEDGNVPSSVIENAQQST